MSSIAERVERSYTVTPGGCWRWMRQADRDGYGRLTIDKRSHLAHRLVLELRGLDLAGMEVDHLCRNRRCVNPVHLDEDAKGVAERTLDRVSRAFGLDDPSEVSAR